MEAAYTGNVAAARILLDAGAAIDAKTEYGKTALDVALSGGKTEVAELLRSRGANGAASTMRPPTPNPAVSSPPTGEATIYVFMLRRIGFSGWEPCWAESSTRPAVFVNGNPHIFRKSAYVEVKVPQGKAKVVSTIVVASPYGTTWTDSRGHCMSVPITTNGVPWASLPGCTGFDFLRIWISGSLSEPEGANATLCEAQLGSLLAMTEEDLLGAGPSGEAVRLCGLKYHPRQTFGGVYSTTAGYDPVELRACHLAVQKALEILTETLPGPAPIQIDAEAGKTYYIDIEWPAGRGVSLENKMRLLDPETGAREIRKLHPAKAE
jgi:hypothetical protein